jgi:sugar transferase (PEP-CTERM/EpsH1 system associated)
MVNSKLINIAHVIPAMNVGGREKVVIDILKQLDRTKFNIEVVCLGDKGGLYDEFESTDLPIHFFKKKAGFRPKLFIELKKHFTKHQYDIVHSHNPGSFIYTAIGAELARIPMIINSEHGYSYDITFRKRLFESFLMNIIDLTLTVSDDLCKKILNRPFVKQSKVKRLYNGIPVEKFLHDVQKRKEIRNFLNVGETTLLIGTIGRLVKVKDHKTLIRSFKIVHQTFPDSKLVIVGEGTRKNELFDLSNQLGLSSEIIFTGTRDDISCILSGLDVFVLSSISEGISITLLEAMAAGLPVVATSVGGNVEIVEDHFSGLLVLPKSPQLMAKALIFMIQNVSKREKFGDTGKKTVMQKFNIKKMIENLEAIYTSTSIS